MRSFKELISSSIPTEDNVIQSKESIGPVLFDISSQKIPESFYQNCMSFYEKNLTNKFRDIYLLRLFNPHKFILEIDEISLNHNIVNTVRNFLGCEPIIMSSQIWWTYPYYNESGAFANPPGNEFGFHYDVDDFKFLKLFEII